MISNDEFSRQMNENFKEIYIKMDLLHKETREDIKELKNDLDSLKSDYKSHIAAGEAIKDQKSSLNLTNNRKFALYLSIIPILLTIYVLFFK